MLLETKEEKMTTLPCPPLDNFSVLSGFITPGSDTSPPHALDASLTVDVLDPTERRERIRVVATDDPFVVEVDWCICGPLASMLSGCWYVQVFIDDLDGVGPTHGQLGSGQVDLASGTFVEGEGTDQKCFEYTFNFAPGSVQAGVYRLVVVITCASGSCDRPEPLLRNMCGYAEVPVLVFYQD
jgi:hypothetical protein